MDDSVTAEAARKVTRVLTASQGGTKFSTDELIPLVYTQLRKLAACKIARERPGQTLQATALVHEAYLRLVNPRAKNWNNQRQFFHIAAEAMRRILIEKYRRKRAQKRGGDQKRTIAELDELSTPEPSIDIIQVNEALNELSQIDEESAELVKLRYFVGLTFAQIAETMDLSEAKVRKLWSFSKAWLYRYMKSGRL